MRVLHLIDPSGPGGGTCTLRLLAETLRHLNRERHDVMLLGHARDAALARRCGVEPTEVICPPVYCNSMARNQMSQSLRGLESRGGAYDIIHAWTTSSAVLAALVAPRRRLLATAAVGPGQGFTRLALRWLHRRRPFPLLAASIGVRKEYELLGLDPKHLGVLPPGVHPDLQHARHDAADGSDADDAPARRRAARARWKLNDDAFVCGLLSDPAAWGDARHAATMMAMLVESGRQAWVVIHPSASRRIETRRWAAKLGMSHRIIVDDALAEPWRVIDGLDAAICISGPNGVGLSGLPSVLPLLWVMAAGVPIVAEAGESTRGVIEDGRTGLLLRPQDPASAAERMIHLMDDRTVAGRLGAAARELIHERFHVSAFCVRLMDIYERLMRHEPVHVLSRENPDVIEIVEQITNIRVPSEL